MCPSSRTTPRLVAMIPAVWERQEVQEMLWGDRALRVPSFDQDAF